MNENELNSYVEELTKDINNNDNFLIRRDNGLLLSNEHISILERYNIDYRKFNNLSSLIYEIEEYLNEDDLDDLEWLSKELSEMNYYQNTNK